MNLGVLLYALRTRDRSRYEQWLAWLDANTATTVLCKERDGKIDFSDCIKVEWPRVCPEDLGYDKDPGAFSIDGRFGGKCALRPPDALDFAAVNTALGVAPPSRMSNWEANSRVLMGLGAEFASALVPGFRELDPPPLLLLSTADPKNFPLHLDGVRILIRMMIRNPELKLNNLPDFPRPEDISPGVLNQLASDGTGPGSIHLAARTIADRYPQNPFFRLLADGPNPETRSLILQRCPSPPGDERLQSDSLAEVGNHWLWEKFPEEVGGKFGAPEFSMGWDCVFVASLYNKMRVRKDIADELLDLFLQYADPLNSALGQAEQAAQLAQAGFDLKKKAFEEAQRALSDAHRFVDTEYANLRNAAANAVQDAIDELARLDAREQEIRSKISDARNRALTLPDEIEEKLFETVCPDWVPPGVDMVCDLVEKVRKVKNQAKQDILNRVVDLEAQLDDLRGRVRGAARNGLSEANRALADLDIKFQSLSTAIASGALDASLEVAILELELQTKTLGEARKALTEVRRAHARVQGLLAIWRDDSAALQAVTEVNYGSFPKDDSIEPGKDEVVVSLGAVDLTHSDGSPPAKLAPTGSYFTIVGSFLTRGGAIRHMLNLQSVASEVEFDVLLPNPASKYWAVVGSKGTTRDLADLLARNARVTGMQRDAYVLRLPFASQIYSEN